MKNSSKNGVLYFAIEGFTGAIKNGVMSLASISILIACLLIMGSFLMVSENINSLLVDLENQNEIVVFIDEKLDEEKTNGVGERIKTLENVRSVEFVSKEQALEEWRANVPDSEKIIEGITVNPLRNSFRIFLVDLGEMEQTTKVLESFSEIVNIRGRLDVSQNLIRLKNVVTFVMICMFIVLAVISVFIIANTIRVAMFARRKEINIMKHVGATDWFIRWPFVFEGIFIGLFSGVIAFMLQVFLYTYIVDSVLSGIELVALLPLAYFLPWLALGFVLIGIIIGATSSVLSVRKYLYA